jgi:hypothetical protein
MGDNDVALPPALLGDLSDGLVPSGLTILFTRVDHLVNPARGLPVDLGHRTPRNVVGFPFPRIVDEQVAGLPVNVGNDTLLAGLGLDLVAHCKALGGKVMHLPGGSLGFAFCLCWLGCGMHGWRLTGSGGSVWRGLRSDRVRSFVSTLSPIAKLCAVR